METNTIASARLLVVSGDSAVLHPIWSMGESAGWLLEVASNAWEAMERVQSGTALDLLLLDLLHGDAEGVHILRWIRRLRPALPVVIVGHNGDLSRRQECLRLGANEFLLRPVGEDHLGAAIQRILNSGEDVGTQITSDDVEIVDSGRFFIGISPKMRKLRAQITLLAEAEAPVLIVGEPGSGKETIARLIHSLSIRSGFAFARVRCAALPGDLLERELLGFESDDCSATTEAQFGKIEVCTNGTILLDEFAEMPVELQCRLFQILTKKEFVRPGSLKSVDIDLRILASTSAKLNRDMDDKSFDPDLYQYLGGYIVQVPPLRDRKEEIPLLARHLIHQYGKQYGLPSRSLSSSMLAAWQAYNWPGNLDEFQHCVKRYLMIGDHELIFQMNRIDQNGRPNGVSGTSGRTVIQTNASQTQYRVSPNGSKSLRALIQSVKSETERNAIAIALEKTGWNRKAAARLLKVSYRTVLYKIEEYKLRSPDGSRLLVGNTSRTNELKADILDPALR